jgi:hypothetical protein
LTYTDQARVARVEAIARDLAASDDRDRGPIHHPLGEELIAQMEAMLARQMHRHAADRARVEANTQTARTRTTIAEEREEEAQRSLRHARTDLPEQPVGGVVLTEWWIPLIIAPILGYLEVRLGAPSIGPALSISETEAALVAVGVAGGLTVAAEALGLVLGSVVRHSRRIARVTLVALAIAVAGSGAWTIVTLASGRSNNLLYRDCKKETEAAQVHELEAEESEGLGSLTRKGRHQSSPASPSGSTGSTSVNPQCKRARPDLGFTVPLTLLATLAATLLATRVGLGVEWRQARGRLREAESRSDSLTKRFDGAREAEPTAAQPLNRSQLELSTAFERETETTTMLFARLSSEYQRWCAHFGRSPRELVLPQVPDPAMLLARMLTGLWGGGAVTPAAPSPFDVPGGAGGPSQSAPEDDLPDPEPSGSDASPDQTRADGLDAETPENGARRSEADAQSGPAARDAADLELKAKPAGYVYDESTMATPEDAEDEDNPE